MADDDIRTMLPDPPPPSPKRRETAIAKAMARFDGTGETSSASAARPTRTAGWWTAIRRPYAGPLVAAALIATITLPFAWTAYDPRGPVAEEAASSAVRDAGPIARVAVDTPAPPAAVVPGPVETAIVRTPMSPARADGAATATKPVEIAQAETAAPPHFSPAPAPPPPAPAAPAMTASEAAPSIVQGRAARR